MPNQHGQKLRGVRGVDQDLWDDFDAAAKTMGSDRSAVSRSLWEWYVGRPGAELPPRPQPRRPGPHPQDNDLESL